MPRTVVGSAERAAKGVLARQERFEKERLEKNSALTMLFRSRQYGAGLTMEEAASKIGMNFRTYAKYLKDPDLMPLSMFRKLQSEFGISEEELFPLLFLKNSAP